MNKNLLYGLIASVCMGLPPCYANQVVSMTVTETHVKNLTSSSKTTEDRTITLGDNWFSVSTPSTLRIYDFTRKKLFVVSTAAKTYSERDMHALCFFRISESRNRLMLQGLMTEVKIANAPFDAYETATELGIIPKDEKPVPIVESKSGDQTIYSHDRKTVVTLTPSATAIAKDCQKSYQRFITQECKMHPQIKKLVGAQAMLPDRLKYQSSPFPQETDSIEYKLKNVTSEPSGPPLSLEGYTEVPADANVQAISKALDKFGPNPKFPTKEDAIAFSKKAMQEGHTLDALLSLLEYGLETGDQLVEPVKDISTAVKSDDDAKRFTGSISPRSKEEAVQDVKNLASLDRSKLQKHAVVDIMQGNIEGQLGHVKEAKQLLVQALTDNPFIVGAYHDLAPLYIHEYDMPSAWECYKIGRSLQPNHPVWAQLTLMEKRMEEENPELF